MSRVAELSPLGQWVYAIGTKYPRLVDTTLTAKDTPPEPDQVYLLGNRYADLAISLAFAFIIPFVRAALRTRVFEVSMPTQSMYQRSTAFTGDHDSIWHDRNAHTVQLGPARHAASTVPASRQLAPNDGAEDPAAHACVRRRGEWAADAAASAACL